MPADLDSTKDVDRAARNSPAAKQNETLRWHSNEEAERKQPRIDAPATGDITHQSIESRGIRGDRDPSSRWVIGEATSAPFFSGKAR
jgi:hypothetical protein